MGMFAEVLRKSKSDTLKHIENFFFTFLLLTSLFSLAIFFAVYLSNYTALLAGLSSLVFFSLNLYDFLNRAHMVKGRVRFISIGSVLDKILFFVFIILFPKKTAFVLVSYFISSVLVSAYLLFVLRIKIIPKINFNYFSKYFFLSLIFLTAASRLPVVIYKFRFGVSSLGSFGIALTFFQAISFIVSQISSFIISRGGKFGEEQFKLLRKLSLIGAALVVGLSAIFIIFVSKYLFSFVGNNYFGSNTMFSIMMFGLGVNVLSFYFTTKLVYKSPKGYMTVFLVYFLLSTAFALIAKDIFEATKLKVLASYLYAAYGFLLADKTT